MIYFRNQSQSGSPSAEQMRTLSRLDALVLGKEKSNADVDASLISSELVEVSLCSTALCQADIFVEITSAQ